MIIHTHPHRITIGGNRSVRIVAFGDLHYGASGANIKRFEENVIAANAKDPDAYFLDMGDSFDCITVRDWRYRPHELASELRGREDIVDAQVEGLAALWAKHKIPRSRLLGKLHGNHEDTILKEGGSNPSERYCYLTKQQNLGYCTFLRLQFCRNKTSSNYDLILYLHHGFAGGRKEGAAVNTYIDHAFRHPGAQVYLYGHNHRKWVHRVPTLSPDWANHEQRDESIIIGNTGTYLMTLGKHNAPSYSEKKGMYPVEIGHLEIIATLRRDRKKMDNGHYKDRGWFDLRVVE